jgi:hypothetical protein
MSDRYLVEGKISKKKPPARPGASKIHHIDRRAAVIAEFAGDDDDLLTEREVAEWFGVSVVWLQIGRLRNYGPKFIRLIPNKIRYRRRACRAYLRGRARALKQRTKSSPPRPIGRPRKTEQKPTSIRLASQTGETKHSERKQS